MGAPLGARRTGTGPRGCSACAGAARTSFRFLSVSGCSRSLSPLFSFYRVKEFITSLGGALNCSGCLNSSRIRRGTWCWLALPGCNNLEFFSLMNFSSLSFPFKVLLIPFNTS